MATVMGGVGYGIYFTAKVRPITWGISSTEKNVDWTLKSHDCFNSDTISHGFAMKPAESIDSN